MKFTPVRSFYPSTAKLVFQAIAVALTVGLLTATAIAQDKKDESGDATFGLYNPATGEIRLFETGDKSRDKEFTQFYQQWVGATGGVLFGDFNRDGHRDFLALNQFKYDGRYYTGIALYTRVPGASPAFRLDYATSRPTGTTVRVGDFDGDGADDLLFYHNFDWASKTYTHFEAHTVHLKKTGTGYDTNQIYATNLPGYYTAELGDFDGDACADLLLQHAFSWAGVKYEAIDVYVLTPGVTGAMAKLLHYATHPASSKVVLGDFDGDGKSDYAVWQPFTYKNLPYTGIQVRGSTKSFAEIASTATHAGVTLRSGQPRSSKIQELVVNHNFTQDKLEYEASETWRMDSKSGGIKQIAALSHLGFIRPGNGGKHPDHGENTALIAYNPNGGQAGVFELDGKYKAVWQKTLPGSYKLVAGEGDPQP